MALIEGNDVSIYYNNGSDLTPDWQLVVCNAEASIDISVDSVETTTKCDAGNMSARAGKVSWSISGQGKVKETTATGEATAADLAALILAGTSKQWAYKNAASDYGYKGTGFLTSLKESAPTNQDETFDFNIQGTGELVILS